MSTEDIATLRAEAPSLTPPTTDTTAPPPEEGGALALPPVDPALVTALTGVVGGLAAPLCRRADVSALEPAEVSALGQSLALLATVYEVGPKDPKAAAWMGLGLTALGIVGNRRKLNTPKEAPAAIAAEPVTVTSSIPIPGIVTPSLADHHPAPRNP